MGKIIKRNDNGQYPFQEWRPGFETPAVHPIGAVTEDRKEDQEHNTIQGVVRMLKLDRSGDLQDGDLDYCLDINADKLGMDPNDLLEIASQWLANEEDGNQ